MKSTKQFIVATALLFVAGLTLPALAGSIENMERERAILMNSLLTSELSPQKRQIKVQVAHSRLIDLERIVLRDKTLAGKVSPAVRAVYENYDLSFLVHASTEHNRTVLDHWLKQVGISTESLMNARVGRR